MSVAAALGDRSRRPDVLDPRYLIRPPTLSTLLVKGLSTKAEWINFKISKSRIRVKEEAARPLDIGNALSNGSGSFQDMSKSPMPLRRQRERADVLSTAPAGEHARKSDAFKSSKSMFLIQAVKPIFAAGI
ncbi:hypothetical protein CH63R_09276 [Colletotrichum higginsianum IMI 349063]|uniref:Uncharacterized protein n=1 Tax=Colletotrichum higginsianum (strain IMI 349063) TaxID=759273 RepID=A0A1B7Y6Z6_COLHI|nr:hypothetical protein CH63R_09276 [Colletotrichum higginsianum IMI 349063]OBR07755.1 hypothetical protein CH63R_09276 [Colletotrichum higginsianum IMI 349063]